MKKTTWIVFSVNNSPVHQISDDGGVDVRTVNNEKMMVAAQNRVAEAEVKVSFKDEMTQNKPKIVDPRVKLLVIDRLKRTRNFS